MVKGLKSSCYRPVSEPVRGERYGKGSNNTKSSRYRPVGEPVRGEGYGKSHQEKNSYWWNSLLAIHQCYMYI